MKLVRAASLFALALTACASAQKSEPATASTAALTSAGEPEQKSKTAAEEWAEKKVAAEAEAPKKASSAPVEKDAAALDPLAMGSELEESSIPTIELTPRGQVRAKSPGELNAALGVVKTASSVEDAAKKLTQRLGKPSWTEAPKGASAKRHVWVAGAGASCHRLVLEADGSVEVESASSSEWRMLAASARQNPCTGEIKRGISK